MKKRRLLSIVLSLCMVLALMPQMVFADTVSSGSCGTNLTWSLDDNGTLTITGTGAMEDWSSNVDVPWHTNCSSIKTIVIDPGVTSIGGLAFLNCTYLTSVTIPDSVTSIGKGAFQSCTSLTGVTIPSSVTLIRGAGFQGCTSLTSVTIPSSVTTIGAGAFENCTGLTSVNIKYGVTSIGEGAFKYCTSLTSITIPSSVTSIGNYAFQNCTGLTSVNIKYGVTSIGHSAFYDCTNLESITIPDSVKSIDNQAFYNCANLESITIPANVTSIGAGAFGGCSSLESIFLPDKDNLTIAGNAIPGTSSQIKYILDTKKGEVTITEIALGTDKTGVAIPATICGYPVVAISDASLLEKISSHTCTGGTATCQTKAICGICKQEYGEKNPDNHTGTKVWEKNETQHKQYWNCCNAVVVDCKDHTWNSGVCSVCDYVCMHTGGEATCTSKATCKYCGEKYGEIDSSNHDLENIPAKDATVTETGNIEYWQCENCKGCFSDKDGKNSIDIADTVTKKLPPEIIEGMDQIITAGEKKALSFTSNAAFDDFKRVGLDGSELSEEYYEKAEGSIIITLDADYVATLPVGEHTIGIVSESGTAETTFTVVEKAAPGTSDDSDKDSKADAEDSAKTGDDTNLVLWLAMMLLSGAGITGVTAYTRRKRTNE